MPPKTEVAKNAAATEVAQNDEAAQRQADAEQPKPALPMAHVYLTTRHSEEFGPEGTFVDRSKAEAEKYGDLLVEASPEQIARRRGGPVSTVVE